MDNNERNLNDSINNDNINKEIRIELPKEEYDNVKVEESCTNKKKSKKLGWISVSLLTLGIVLLLCGVAFGVLSKQSKNTVNKDKTEFNVQQVSKKDSTPNWVSSIVEKVMPSIVTISTEKLKYNSFETPIAKSVGNGTGFILQENTDSYYIATNNHVVEDSDTITVTFSDNTSVKATIKGADSDEDLALIEVKKSDMSSDTINSIKVAEIGKSSELSIGDDVIAIGNALGYGQSVTKGIVSALDRGQNISDNYLPLIQTDAAINPGNSGGPLVNADGQVVGINTVKLASNEIEGIGYAIPSDIFVPEFEYLESGKDNTNNTYLGVTVRYIDEQIASAYGWPVGLYVLEVSGEPAKNGGLMKGDIIEKIDGVDIINTKNFQRILRQHKPGDEIKLSVYRFNGEKIELKIILGEKDE